MTETRKPGTMVRSVNEAKTFFRGRSVQRTLPGISGAQKAAVFILSLEEDVAAQLLRGLSDHEVERLMGELSNRSVLEEATVEAVLEEFSDLTRLHGALSEGGVDEALRLVDTTFPPERARELAQVLESNRPNLPFAFLSQAETSAIVSLLDGERPQTVAVVLAHMAPAKAWDVLEQLPDARRQDLLRRIAALEGTHEDVLRHLETSLKRHLGSSSPARSKRGGLDAAAEIVKASGEEQSDLLGALADEAPDLGAEVSRRVSGFEDLVRLEKRTLRQLLAETDRIDWELALRAAPRALRDRVLSCLSSSEARALRAKVDEPGAVKLADIERSRGEILASMARVERARSRSKKRRGAGDGVD